MDDDSVMAQERRQEPSHPHETEVPRVEVPRLSMLPGSGRSGITILIACAILALGVGILIGRKFAPKERQESGVSTPTPTSRRVHMTTVLAERSGIRAERADRRAFAPTLELLGSIDFDADRLAEVGGRIGGRITRLLVRPGDDVVEGTPLAEIESTSIGDALATHLTADANLAAAQAQLRRELALSAQQLTTARALESARADAQRFVAEVRGAEERLLAMGFTYAEIHSNAARRGQLRITLRSPIAGRVVRRDAVAGQSVDATDRIFSIADLTHLWVQLDVFERDLARVHLGDHAEIRSETYPGRAFSGVVNHVSATIDAQTRTARVRIEVDNPEYLLRPGQFVTARVRSQEAGAHSGVSIQRRAVIQLEGRPAAFVRVGPEEYDARSIDLGTVDGDWVEVTHGLDAGEDVVTDGTFALKSELER